MTIAVTGRGQTMSDYIKREDALRAFNGSCSTVDADDILRHLHKSIDVIKNIPSADVRENVRGEWITTHLDHVAMGERPKILYCSVCNQCIAYPTNYCPNCGADMRPISALSENVEIVSNLKRGES